MGQGGTQFAPSAVQSPLQPPALLLGPQAFGGKPQHRLVSGKEGPQGCPLPLKAARHDGRLGRLVALGQGGLKRPEPRPHLCRHRLSAAARPVRLHQGRRLRAFQTPERIHRKEGNGLPQAAFQVPFHLVAKRLEGAGLQGFKGFHVEYRYQPIG